MLATAVTSSPSRAGTPSPSASSAPLAPSTVAPSGIQAANATPWGRPLDETTVLILSTWTYAGTGYTALFPGAELALTSADVARGR